MDRHLFRKIVTFILGACTSFVVSRFLRTYTPAKNRFEKIVIWIGVFGIAGLVRQRVERRANNQLDEIYKGIDDSRAARS
jgi:hypothetical protein